MPHFNAKMHQNRFRLGLLPRWGSLQRSPNPLAGFKGPTSKGRVGEGKGWEGRAWDGRGGEGRRRSTCLPPHFDNPGYGPDGGNGKMVMEK